MLLNLVIGILPPLFIGLLCIPMIQGSVGPNDTYGFRTRKTQSSPEIWYAANRAAGKYLVWACGASILTNVALCILLGSDSELIAIWMMFGLLAWIFAALAMSFKALRKL